MAKLRIPTREVEMFNEVRGEIRTTYIEDRPYRLLKEQFIEHKGCYDDIKEYLTDYEILEAGGLERFFNDDGSRRDGSWPYDPEVMPAAKKAKKKTKKKAKKKASK